MRLWVECRPYKRPFCQPLKTAHGLWSVRRGVLLKLTDEAGRSGYGEVAPIPWFGSESVEAALAFLQEMRGWQEDVRLRKIPPELPACQFGFGLALGDLEGLRGGLEPEPKAVCALLPAGEAALSQWQTAWERGHRTFKWKVGVYGLKVELECLQALAQKLPAGGQLRLDANGGLAEVEATQWLEECDGLPGKVEFLEQPLPPDQVESMQRLSQRYHTPMALDESVATLAQLKACWRRGWSGVYVIKPAICGYPAELARFVSEHFLDAVFSSALETGVGRRGAFALSRQMQFQRALGFGTGSLFNDDWDTLAAEQLWERA